MGNITNHYLLTYSLKKPLLRRDQEQSPEVAQTENEEVPVHTVHNEEDRTTIFEESVGITNENCLTSPFGDLTLRAQETVVNDTVSSTSSESSLSPEPSTEPCRISPSLHKGSYFITNALTQKLIKLAGSKDHRNASLMGVRLHHSIKQQLELDENCQIKLKNLEKVGKAVAKRLSVEYGSAGAVLSAA
uniref:Uncharacterized protein n=1 Tax=Knipowitschia caucasica TaxID=637954 RepID=A0AAV2ISR9_KNICA